MTERAYARRHDPDTSHEAAAAVTPNLGELQQRVESYAFSKGPEGFTDAEMAHDLQDPGSTYRTRRHELAARNVVLDSGQRRTFGPSARKRIVWVHRRFADNPPPVCEPPRVMTPADRQRGTAIAIRLEGSARQMDNEGRALFATSLREAADFIRTYMA